MPVVPIASAVVSLVPDAQPAGRDLGAAGDLDGDRRRASTSLYGRRRSRSDSSCGYLARRDPRTSTVRASLRPDTMSDIVCPATGGSDIVGGSRLSVPAQAASASVETTRRDAWWRPSARHLSRLHSPSSSTRPGPASQNANYEYGPVPLAVLLAGAVRPVAARVVRRTGQAGLVAVVAAVLAGVADPLGPGRLPLHLLLLPRRLLQGVLGRPAGLRRRRAAQEVPRRALVSAHHPEHPPLLPLPRAALHRHPGLRRVEGDVVRRSPATAGTTEFGIGVGTLVLAVNVVLPRRLHVRLPLAAAPGRRRARRACPAGRCARRRTTASSCLNRGTCSGPGSACSRSAFSDLYVRLLLDGRLDTIWQDSF